MAPTDTQLTPVPMLDVLGVPMLDVNRQNGPLQEELSAALAAVCASGAFVNGPAVKQFEEEMARYCGTRHAIGCASGSDALLLALMALGIGPGDEVIVPSFTFFATASSVTRLGATPVFTDIVPETFNVDPGDIARKITPRTKAIMPVHLFGQCANMGAINTLAREAGRIPVIEDAAQAIGAEFEHRRAGSLGRMGCFSFYPTKNLGGLGDGGLITTDNTELADKLRILRDHGQHPRYYHHEVGINSRLDALQAAALSVKLPRLDSYAAGRQKNAQAYAREFARTGLDSRIAIPTVKPGCASVWNQFTVRVRDGERDNLQKHLAERKIGAAVYYPVPLHLQKCFAFLGHHEGSLPVTELACREVLSLPIYECLTTDEQTQVIGAIAEYFGFAANRQAA
ncbi:MAG: DegT/DnrJ/EryC1/StrS family aminotransferase [Bythopirellula sp.]|nr:DegT/DnrJ/EryC1/StrS family aminotransferase [Bythopirellula sp.]